MLSTFPFAHTPVVSCDSTILSTIKRPVAWLPATAISTIPKSKNLARRLAAVGGFVTAFICTHADWLMSTFCTRHAPFGNFLKEVYSGLWNKRLVGKTHEASSEESPNLQEDLRSWGKTYPTNPEKAKNLIHEIARVSESQVVYIVVNDASGVTPTSRPWLEQLAEKAVILAAADPKVLNPCPCPSPLCCMGYSDALRCSSARRPRPLRHRWHFHCRDASLLPFSAFSTQTSLEQLDHCNTALAAILHPPNYCIYATTALLHSLNHPLYCTTAFT